MDKKQVLAEFKRVSEERHKYAKEWKERTGGKVIGCLCTWVPEELIYAAGALPIRILGSHEPQDVVEPHMYGMWCAYSRDCLAQGLLGRYDYLDGIVYAQGCYHIRQSFDAWKRHVPTTFSHYFYMPTNVTRKGAQPQVVREMGMLQTALEGLTGKAITPQALSQAVALLNANRRLMRQVYEARKADIPPIHGSEAMHMVYASQVMDKRDHNQLLSELVAHLGDPDGRRQPSVRLMIVGSELDDPSIYELIESLGGEVVIDEDCIGARYFWTEVNPDSDIVGAIATRYVNKPPCPVYDYDQERRRLPFIRTLAQEYRVQGAILIQMKFCDPHEYDMPVIQRMFKSMNIPTLKLEVDITIPAGQFRTRIEALYETIQLEV